MKILTNVDSIIVILKSFKVLFAEIITTFHRFGNIGRDYFSRILIKGFESFSKLYRFIIFKCKK